MNLGELKENQRASPLLPTRLPTHSGIEAKRKAMIVEIHLDAKVGAFMYRYRALSTVEWFTS